jgi:hypothetical protein
MLFVEGPDSFSGTGTVNSLNCEVQKKFFYACVTTNVESLIPVL